MADIYISGKSSMFRPGLFGRPDRPDRTDRHGGHFFSMEVIPPYKNTQMDNPK